LADLLERRVDVFVEGGGRNDTAHQADSLGFFRTDDATGQHEIGGVLLTNGAPEHRHHHRGHEADAHLRIAELGTFVSENDIARRGESGAAGDRASTYRAHDGLHQCSNREEHASECFGVGAMCVAARFQCLLQRVEIGAGAKIIALGAKVNDATGGIGLELRERGEQLIGHLAVEGVLLLRTCENDPSDSAITEDPNASHG